MPRTHSLLAHPKQQETAALLWYKDAYWSLAWEHYTFGSIRDSCCIDTYAYGHLDAGPMRQMAALLMQLCEGGSVEGLLWPKGAPSAATAAAYRVKQSLKPDMARQVLQQAAAAVQALHRRRVVYHDLKPSNLLLNGLSSTGEGVVHRLQLFFFDEYG